MLPAKLEAAQLTGSEDPPEKGFGVGLVVTQTTREVEDMRGQRRFVRHDGSFDVPLTLTLSRRERG